MAVYGYSIVQGLKVFETQGKNLEPDIVTLYFGWNDHWLSMQNDSSRMATRVNPLYGYLYEHLKDKRLFMFISWLRSRPGSLEPTRKEPGFRVPPKQYRAVLQKFITDIRAAGARPLVIMAPRRDANQRTREEFADIEMDFNKVHDQYLEITRQVAEEENADLLDLQHMFASTQYDKCFEDDRIHMKQPGLTHVATALYQKIQEMISQEK